MARKKTVPVEEQETNLEGFGLPETETTEETYEFPDGLPERTEENTEVPPVDTVELPQDGTPPSDAPDIPPDSGETPEMPDNGDTPPEPPAEP